MGERDLHPPAVRRVWLDPARRRTGRARRDVPHALRRASRARSEAHVEGGTRSRLDSRRDGALDRAGQRPRLLRRRSAPHARREVRPRRRRGRPLRVRGPSRRPAALLRREHQRGSQHALDPRGRRALRRQSRPHGLQLAPHPPPRARAALGAGPRQRTGPLRGRYPAGPRRHGPLRRARRRVRPPRHLPHHRPLRLALALRQVALARHRPRRLHHAHPRLQGPLLVLGTRLLQPLRLVAEFPLPRESLHRAQPRRRTRTLHPGAHQRGQPRQPRLRRPPQTARRQGGVGGVACGEVRRPGVRRNPAVVPGGPLRR